MKKLDIPNKRELLWKNKLISNSFSTVSVLVSASTAYYASVVARG